MEVYINHSVFILLFLEQFCRFEIFQKKKKKLGGTSRFGCCFYLHRDGEEWGWRGWVWGRGEQHFLLDKFQRPCDIQMLGDETGRKDFEPLSIKALILWGSPSQSTDQHDVGVVHYVSTTERLPVIKMMSVALDNRKIANDIN